MFNKKSNVKEKIFEKKKARIQKFKPYFTTIDGVEHEGVNYNWCISDRVSCTVPEYLMISINHDKFIEDVNEIMYMLSNVISIRWELLDERIVEDKFSDFKVFLTNKDLEKC
jgi:hypothetical protein